MEGALHTLHVWGSLACFSRPEAKVERLSYPVITPSAARGIFDAILWQPGLRWQLSRVEVLSPVRTVELTRNEVRGRIQGHTTVLAWADGRKPITPLMADGKDANLGRTIRQTVALRDVAYRLHARMIAYEGQSLQGRDAQFRRRVARGQCLHQPFFGNKEMAAYFRFPQPDDPAPQALNLNLGLMVYDVFTPDGSPSVSLFHAHLRQGVMDVPDFCSDLVLKMGHG